ncbi:hypothetical protein GGS23DRAFT_618394 [Durotheca rogersii]|uniref:uncharacterized protein n=1 Tax=Durotheca rogersii TaxID=419775 RepID=UPI00221F1C73|nr:uncharacterized protein GGS23DRAFT_618394 [Durotheca rogersii]KAI5865344.1 hypothetical protein GGS23DRAFT_618394 [Durotheca rogersii]
MASSASQEGEERKAFIAELMREHSRLGHDSNNFVYRLKLSVSDSLPVSRPSHYRRPGTVTLPADATDAVIRISNPHALVNENVRVQNEVAAMSLMRDALAGEWEDLVPRVYAWSPSSEGREWIVQEYKQGVQLDKLFGDLGPESQRDVVRQVVPVYKLIQNYQLSVFADHVVTGPTTIPCGGPFDTLLDMYARMLRRLLDESDTSDRLKGWRQNSRRERLEHFAPHGIVRQTRDSCAPDTFNMLFNPSSNRVTALLDFDFSHVTSPADEYFYSLRTFGALLIGPFEDGDEGLLRTCLLEGFGGKVPSEPDGKGRANWTVAVMMDEERHRAGPLRPADIIHGRGELAALYWFLEDVSLPYFFMSRWVESRKPEDIDNIHRSISKSLDRYLARWA